MYQFSYADIVDESPFEGRSREYEALTRAIELMEQADVEGVESMTGVKTIHKMRQMWTLIVEDVGRPECELAPPLRASIVSIGLWAFRELEDLRTGKAKSFAGLIDITRIIAEGLR